MKIGIIGATGFIGRSMLRHLAQEGRPAAAFARRPLDQATVSDSIAFHQIGSADWDLHLATLDWAIFCTGSMLPSEQVSAEQLHSAAQETLLLEKCIQQVRTGVLYVSSGGAVYGNTQRVPVSESETCTPISFYGKYKLAMERQADELAKSTHKRLVIARLSNPYGPLQTALNGQGLIARLLQCYRSAAPFTLWGSGDAVRDYIHIDDFGRFVTTAIDQGAHGIFNVGSGEGRTVIQILELFASLAPHLPITIEKIAARQCDVSRIILDISKSNTILGWKPQRELVDGLRLLILSS